jgi:hypothetical protein
VTTTTYNEQNELVQVVGPATDLQLVYDGQGDRLRSYEQAVASPVIANDAQDLVGAPGNRVNTGDQPLPNGLPDLVNDGTQDYLYLQPCGCAESGFVVDFVATDAPPDHVRVITACRTAIVESRAAAGREAELENVWMIGHLMHAQAAIERPALL